MSANPYEAPSEDEPAFGVLSGKREDLLAVARYQKGIIFCILAYFAVVVGSALAPGNLRMILGFVILAIGFASAAFVILLSLKVYSTGAGILMGILALVPCLGLLVLLLINSRATKIMTANGIKVGLLGAKI